MTALPPELPPPLPISATRETVTGMSPTTVHGSAIPMPMAIPVKSSRGRSAWPVVAWASLAAIAVTYMGLVAVRPDLVARVVPANGSGESRSVAESGRTPGGGENVESLRSTVKSLEKEIATLRSKLAAAEPSGDANPIAGITAQEPQPGTIITGSTGPASTDPASAAAVPASDDGRELPAGPNLRLTPAPTAQAPATPTTPSADLAAVPAPSSTTDGIRIINGGTAAAVAQATPKSAIAATPKVEQGAKIATKSETPTKTGVAANSARIETGSVEPPVRASEIPAFGEAVVKPEPKPLGLAIGSGPTVDTLRLNWSLISESNAEQLAKLEPRYKTSVDGNGLVYNLFAGPIKSKAQGRELCKALAKRAIPCAVVDDFGGEGL